MKKGVSYIDIAISAGIFILYLLFVFVTLRPGIKEDVKGDYLIQIVENGFYQTAFINISKYPLFVDIENLWGPNLDGVIELSGFPFSWTENKTKILGKNNELKIFNITFDSQINKSNLTILDNSNNLKTGQNLFGLFHSENFNFTPDFSSPGSGITPRIRNPTHLNFTVGVAERSFGIGNQTIFNLKDITYDQTKSNINFPEEKEFFITIYDATNTDKALFGYGSSAQPDLEKFIFVLQWSDILIKDDGNSIPVIVNVRAW